MRILHTIESSALGGAENVALTLACSLSCYGLEPVLAAPPESWLQSRAKDLGMAFLPLPERRRTDLSFVSWLCKSLREYDISLVHAHMMAMNLYGSIAARLRRIPSISTFHGRHYDFETRRRRLVYYLISLFSNRIVAVSEDSKQALVKEARISPKRVCVIPNAVDIARFTPAFQENGRKDGQTILSVGSLTRVKGHDYLLRAFAQVATEHPAARLLIAGEGPERHPLEGLGDELGLGDKVAFLGRRDDVPRLFADADIFALASRSEGQSLSIMEAMAASLPVVVTDVGGNAEIVSHNQTGFLVPPGSVDQLSAALCLLLQNRAKATQMGAGGRRRVDECFSLKLTVQRYLALYRELLPAAKAAELKRLGGHK